MPILPNGSIDSTQSQSKLLRTKEFWLIFPKTYPADPKLIGKLKRPRIAKPLGKTKKQHWKSDTTRLQDVLKSCNSQAKVILVLRKMSRTEQKRPTYICTTAFTYIYGQLLLAKIQNQFREKNSLFNR